MARSAIVVGAHSQGPVGSLYSEVVRVNDGDITVELAQVALEGEVVPGAPLSEDIEVSHSVTADVRYASAKTSVGETTRINRLARRRCSGDETGGKTASWWLITIAIRRARESATFSRLSS